MYLSVKGKHYLRVKGWKTIFQANGPKKKSWSSHSNIEKQIDFQPKVLQKDKQGHFLLIKGKFTKMNPQF